MRRDEDAARVSRVIHVLSIGLIVAVLPAVFHNLAAGFVSAAAVLTVQVIVSAVCLVLARRGALQMASRLLTLGVIALAASLQYLSPDGVHDVSILIYPGVIILAGALLDRLWFVLCTLTTMAVFGTLYGLEMAGLLLYRHSHFAEAGLLIDGETILAMAGLGVGLIMGSLRSSMDRSRAAAESLRESEELYRSLFEAVSEAILVLDPMTGRIVDGNRRAAQWFGFSIDELRSMQFEALWSPPEGSSKPGAAAYARFAADGLPQLFEWQARARDGRVFWVEVSMHATHIASSARVLVSLRDIDERKRAAADRQRLEAQLLQAQKLESVGQLAGGVAHDFNNLLTCIFGNLDLADRDPSSSRIRRNLNEVRGAAQRAADLTSRLLAFSRKQPIAPRPLDPGQLIESVHRMLERLLGETVALQLEVTPDTGTIRADPGQLEQILMNLAVNARDAMPKGGTLTITADTTFVDQAFCALHSSARTGSFVRIRVRDTGTGMSDEVKQHLFEPFFTTKPAGKGTGLGLAMVFGAIQQNQGFILIDSELGRGSSFDLYFPRLPGKAPITAAPEAKTGVPTGSERILLVEDDASVRQLSERVLNEHGYRVVACASGKEAIAASKSADVPLDLLIADVILPDIDGRAVATEVVKHWPALRVLYCSGHIGEVIAHHGVVEEGLFFLPKPFNAEDLVRKVRAVLDRTAFASG